MITICVFVNLCFCIGDTVKPQTIINKYILYGRLLNHIVYKLIETKQLFRDFLFMKPQYVRV